MISDPCPAGCGRMLHPGPCIFGAMKGVFSGPEADAYFGERTGGTDATDAETRECFHKAHAEALASGKGGIAAEEAGWRAVYELGTGPALFKSLPRDAFEQIASKPLPGLENAVARGEEEARGGAMEWLRNGAAEVAAALPVDREDERIVDALVAKRTADMATRRTWACPKCGAERDKHGEGGADICKMRPKPPGECHGFRRQTDLDNPRQHGFCYHCRWKGQVEQ